jgi:hypothetical protein
MTIARRWLVRGVAGLGLGVAVTAVTGCQTYPAGFGGLTLPSPHYLKHYPQYFPPDPPFPLQRELESMQAPELLLGPRAGGVLPGPAPLPPGAEIPPPAPVPAPGMPADGGGK